MNSCVYCGIEFVPTRSDAKFCSTTCRTTYHNRKKKEPVETLENAPVKAAKKSTSSNEERRLDKHKKRADEIRYELERLTELLKQQNTRKEALTKELLEVHEEIKENEKLLSEIPRKQGSDRDRYVKTVALMVEGYNKMSPQERIVARRKMSDEIELSLRRALGKRDSLEKVMSRLVKESDDLTVQINKTLQLLESNQKNGSTLDEYRFGIISQERRKEVTLRMKKKIPTSKAINDKVLDASQIREMEFETFQIEGELGAFLGQLDRNMVSIALIGNTNAGKSYFAYRLAKLFKDYGDTVKIFSLEEGIGETTKKKLNLYSIGKGLHVVGEGKLSDVRKSAKQYNVIVIDSFQKLDAKAEDFESLRQTYVNTIFITIFQKTSAGTIRGGYSINHNSTAIIDIKRNDEGERIAVMEKSRYGTEGWILDIDTETIIKENG